MSELIEIIQKDIDELGLELVDPLKIKELLDSLSECKNYIICWDSVPDGASNA